MSYDITPFDFILNKTFKWSNKGVPSIHGPNFNLHRVFVSKSQSTTSNSFDTLDINESFFQLFIGWKVGKINLLNKLKELKS